jgi:hypothetical protein
MGTRPPPPMGARVPTVDIFYIDGGCSWISSSGTSQGVCCRHFLALMVDTPGSSAPAPSRGPPSTFFSIDSGCFRISSSGTSQGPTVDMFYVDDGHSWISVNTRQGAHHQCFLALMMDTPGSPSTLAKRPTIDIFSVDGGHSRISGTAS